VRTRASRRAKTSRARVDGRHAVHPIAGKSSRGPPAQA
jgi:hypothetical protein